MDAKELRDMYFAYARTKGQTIYGTLSELFSKAWSRDTASPSAQAQWTPRNPAWGQCAVTALVVQDLCGGDLVRAEVPNYGSHYFNHLVNGEDYSVYDLTRHQFPSGTTVPPGKVVDRAYVLESARAATYRTMDRYELLKTRVAEAIRGS